MWKVTLRGFSFNFCRNDDNYVTKRDNNAILPLQ